MTRTDLLGAYGVSAERVAAAVAHVGRLEEERLARRYAAGAAKRVASRKATLKARAVAQAKAVRKARRARRKAEGLPGKRVRLLPHAPGWWVMLDRMEIGAWYALADVAALMPEYRRNSVKAWLYHLDKPPRRLNLVERVLNPEHDHSRPARRQSEPMFLFRRVR